MPPKVPSSKDSPSNHELISHAEDTCGGSVCCTSGSLPCHSKDVVPASRIVDPESQAMGIEHVVFAISGMTCSGCETKLSRTLAAFDGVKNLQTSLVLSRVEFDLDLGLSTVERVVKYLERTTEFKCEVITKNGSTLDILVSENTTTFINRLWPEGVIEISSADKRVVRVTFEPQSIGARDLMENHWAGIAKLAPANHDQVLVAGKKHVRHVGLMTILSVALTIPVLVLAWAPIHVGEVASGSTSLALATIVQFLIAGPFYPKALKALIFSRVIEMDLLIVLSTSIAYIFSLVSFGLSVAGNPLLTGQFFETSTLLVTLIMVGRYISALARQKAVESISIKSLQTPKAILTDDSSSPETREIDARLLQYGDLFNVPPDSRIPTDGTVLSGFSEVDESMLTGESRPIEKYAKSSIIAGTINGSGTLIARVTRLPGDNTISLIAAMVDEAKLSKPHLQELADKVSSYFVPVILALAIVTFLVWIAVGISMQAKPGSEAVVQAITYAITVLIVSCPCAIGLAVPMVVVIVCGMTSKSGVIFKSAGAIEVAYKTSHVVLDKTGTLTKGNMNVAIENYNEHGRDQMALLLGLLSDSKHPVSVAVKNHLKEKGILASAVPGAINVIGCGVESQLDGQSLKAGNARWLNLPTNSLVQPVLSRGYTTFCFTIDGVLCAVFGLEDSLRDSAEYLVSNLHQRGISVHVVSGDDDGSVNNVATKLGITESNVHARSSPADKQTYIKKLMDDFTDTKPVVIFCGDGANDAVALAQATIGIHINEGSDIAQSAADVVLMRPDLSGVLTVIDASNASVRRIKFNFGWSFVYNTFAVLLAAGAFVKARIPPEFSGLGELVSVLPVIAAAVLLRWSQF
jgi:Cu2+-exporting ATPase